MHGYKKIYTIYLIIIATHTSLCIHTYTNTKLKEILKYVHLLKERERKKDTRKDECITSFLLEKYFFKKEKVNVKF